ncbi:nitroreductase family protein [Polymorphobacter multimanifer]|uniref:Nitroreductase n=1 Tax=Polymorphobacter multimanifer TaxID=1070431 RepID=A0A841L6F3_9SPHN|nr:nitroreductase family protein [Polymorphobacter multimanifer]MBB6228539.1 nitroreductase [Polymorphobacter multimanifer]
MKLQTDLLAAEEASRIYGRRGGRRILHSILPTGAYDWLRGYRLRFNASDLGRRWHSFEAGLLALTARSGVLSGLHYTLFSREFDREHRAVLAARARHVADVYAGRGNLYMLRRNVHRIEKGLIMKPARPLFALAMIEETVRAFGDCLARAQENQSADIVSLQWADQILQEYFGRVDNHPIVARARTAYEAVVAREAARLADEQNRTPFKRGTSAGLPTIEAMEALALHRRSVRWFDDRPVPRAVIDRAVDVAGFSPTACNRQPFRFEVFDTPEAVARVGAIPKGTPGWLHQIPCFLVIIGKFEAFRFERDRHIPYIDGCLSAMSLIYALEVQGVSSCCVNFPDYADTERRMAETLGLPPWERAVMCLAIGYPDAEERVPYSQKLPLAALRRYNHFADPD